MSFQSVLEHEMKGSGNLSKLPRTLTDSCLQFVWPMDTRLFTGVTHIYHFPIWNYTCTDLVNVPLYIEKLKTPSWPIEKKINSLK